MARSGGLADRTSAIFILSAAAAGGAVDDPARSASMCACGTRTAAWRSTPSRWAGVSRSELARDGFGGSHVEFQSAPPSRARRLRVRIAARLALSAAIAAPPVAARGGATSRSTISPAWRRCRRRCTSSGSRCTCHLVVRSQRFRVLLPREHRPSSAVMLAVSAASPAYVLPAKTGELTLVMYLKATSGVPKALGLRGAGGLACSISRRSRSASRARRCGWLMRSDAAPAWPFRARWCCSRSRSS